MQALFTKTIQYICDVLRSEGKTGTESVAHCILFVTARYLSPEICQRVGIPVEYAFCNMIPDNIIINEHDLFNKFVSSIENESFYKHFQQKLGFNTLKFGLSSPRNLHLILTELKKVDIHQLNLSHDVIGLIYELYLADGNANTLKGLGQFFTPRPIIRFMVELCNPGIKDGRIETVFDPSMGTGGFITLALQHIIRNNPGIDKQLLNDALYGVDIDQNVRNMAVFNLLLESGIKFTNLYRANTLTDDIRLADGTLLDKVDVILANPPMGGNVPEYKDCCGRIHELKIPGRENEPLFTQLIMKILNDNGRCAIIVPEGFLFKSIKLHVLTRKHMIENFNVRKVIEIPKGSFINTPINTYIIYFENTELKTQEVVCSKIKLVGNAIYEEHQITLSINDIRNKKYILLGSQYYIDEKRYSNMKYVKLGAMCESGKKSKRQAKEGKAQGLYPYFTSSNEVKRIDVADYKEEYLIIGTGGSANIKISSEFSCSADNILIRSKFPLSFSNKYIYHYLNNNIHLLEKTFRGTGLGHPTKEGILNIEIPFPDAYTQNYIVNKCERDIETLKLLKRKMKEIVENMPVFINETLDKYDVDKDVKFDNDSINIDQIEEKINALNI